MCISPESSNDSKETHTASPPFPQPCRNIFTHSTTAPNRTPAMWPRQGQSQRLVSHCLQNLTTDNWILFCFGRGQSTPRLDDDSKSLAGPAEATGMLSALIRSWQGDWSHQKGELTQPFNCSFFPKHLEKAVTSRSINSLRGPLGHRPSCLPRGMLSIIHSTTQMYCLHLGVFFPRHEPRDFN